VPPNQHADVEIIPTFDRSSVTVKYSVTATTPCRNAGRTLKISKPRSIVRRARDSSSVA
jgi:hypothetical protein